MVRPKKSARKSTGSDRINERASTSNGVCSPYEALALENEELSRKCPTISIECVKCHKWRPSRQYFETREIPDAWQCTMWITKDGKRGSCDMPGSTDDSKIKHEPFPEGEIVWGKLGKYEYWPGMIESDPVEMLSTKFSQAGRKQYNVTFFGLQPLRQWVFASNIRKYEKTDPAAFRGKGLKLAIAQGNEAIHTPFKIRIKKYSLATLRGEKCSRTRRTTMLNGRPENGCYDASEADDGKGPSTDESNTEPAGESAASSSASEETSVPGTTEELVSCETPVNCIEDGQQASPDSISSFDPLADRMQPQLMHQGLPSPTDRRTEEKQNDTDGDERREEPTPCLTSSSASRIDSTDHEYDSDESFQSNKPSPSSSHLESDDEEEDLSKEAMAYKAFLDEFHPSTILNLHPSSSYLESDDDDEEDLSEEALAYKAFLDEFYPSTITGPF